MFAIYQILLDWIGLENIQVTSKYENQRTTTTPGHNPIHETSEQWLAENIKISYGNQRMPYTTQGEAQDLYLGTFCLRTDQSQPLQAVK